MKWALGQALLQRLTQRLDAAKLNAARPFQMFKAAFGQDAAIEAKFVGFG